MCEHAFMDDVVINMTMKSEEIAKLAGVSRSTVSRVVNNYSNVPPATRRKVMKVIEEYNYVPNSSARMLAGKGSLTLGLFIVSIADKSSANRIYQNNYFAPFVDTVIDSANQLGYYALVHTVYTEQDYIRVRQAFLERRIDCGIIVGTQKDAGDLMGISQLGHPLVIIDCDREEFCEYPNVALFNTTDTEGTRGALEYLIGLGHRSIGIIAGRMDTYSGRQRFLAYQQTMTANGLTMDPRFVLHGEFLKGPTYQEVKRLVHGGVLPTALFSSSDDMAITAIEALKEEGIQVPTDISVIGFDDLPVAAQIDLTTVSVPVHAMAKKAVEHVIGAVEGEKPSFQVLRFPTKLIVRRTCTSISPE